MHVVAITRLAGSLEEEAEALAAALGTLAYDAKLALRAGLPAVVFTSPDAETAAAVLANVRGRGHGAIACDSDAVVAAAEMKLVKRFRLDPGALVALTDIGETALPWTEIAVLLRATHRTHAQTTVAVKERQFAIGRALATGGLSVSKTKTRDVTTHSDATDPVLYIYRTTGEQPWLVSQPRTLFHGLGDRMQPTAAPNFALAVTMLRERAPHARFDDRLVQRRVGVDELDLLAHIIAHE